MLNWDDPLTTTAAEKQTVTEGRQSGVTQQDIEPHGEYNPNHDLNSQ